jgi:diguanylate cyclase (GGDEF)-like protein
VQYRPYPFQPEELKRLAITDELTGLYNRRYFKFRLKEEMERARRSDRELSLLLLDLDGLKSVNDIYGHLRGDKLLTDFSEEIVNQVRPFDLVARYSGDEFVILLPESGKIEAEMIAERVRKTVSEKAFHGEPDLKATASIGLAIFPVDGDDSDTLIAAADKGLYAAKRLGRNRVACASDESVSGDEKRGLSEIRLVGRDEELFLLGKHLSSAIRGQSGVVMVTGEVGVGRSRLLAEFNGQAKQAGALVLFESCYEHARFIPHQPIRGALRSYIAAEPQKAYQSMLGLNEVQRQEMQRLLPELDPARLEISEAPRASSDEEFQLFDAITQYLIQLSQNDPVVLMFDDLHWLDDATTKFMIYMIRSVKTHRILVVGSFMSGDPTDTGMGKLALKVWLKGFREITDVSIIELFRLNRARTRECVHALLGQAFPLDFTDLIHRESEGNPFFIEEILKSLIEQNILQWSDKGWKTQKIKQLTAPESIREMIFSQLDRLEDEDRKILTMAAVIGRLFDFDTLQQVSGLNEGHLLDVLERLENLQLIHQLPSQHGEEYQFTHKKIREVLYDQLDSRRVRKAHQRIAVALERLHHGKTEMIAGELARHYTKGGMTERAVYLYRRAGDKAYALHAESSALRYYTRAINLIGSDPDQYAQELSALHQKIALILRAQGRGIQAIEKFNLAMEVGSSFMTPFRKAQIHRWVAQIHVDNGRFSAATREIRMAENLLDPAQDKLEFLRLETCKASLMLHRGEYEACLQLTQNYIKELKGSQYFVELSDIYDLMAAAEYKIGHRDVAVRLYSDSLELRRKARDLSRISKSYNNLAGIFMEAGRWVDALHWYQKCIRIEETLGHFASLAHPHAMVAKILIWQNSLDEAEKHCKKSIQIRELSDDMPGLAICQTILTDIYLKRGDTEKAKKSLQKAEKLHSEHEIGIAGQHVVMARASLEMEMGNLETATIVADDILRINQLFGDQAGRGDALMMIGKIERSSGKFGDAMKHYEEAEAIYTNLHNRVELARCLKEKGLLAKEQGNSLVSYQHLTAAREIFSEIGYETAENEVTKLIEEVA